MATKPIYGNASLLVTYYICTWGTVAICGILRCMAERRDTMLRRMMRASMLEAAVYEEVEHDRSANQQALAVVLLVGLATGIGFVTTYGLTGFFIGVISGLVGWGAWSIVTLFIGTRLLPGANTEANIGQMTRTIAFAASPGILRLLGFIPGIAGYLYQGTNLWMLVTMVVAVRQALDYDSTWRAVAVVGIGYLIVVIMPLILLNMMAPV